MDTRDTNVFMNEAASIVLARHGIRYREKRAGGTIWYNFVRCPLCAHENYQCGISESETPDGRLIHGVKCWHVADNGFGTDTPRYEDFLYRIGELTAEEYDRIKGRASGQRPQSTSKLQSKPLITRNEEPLRSLNIDFHGKLRKRLRENQGALQYLENRGISLETVNYFGLGLSTPYTSRKTCEEQADALVYPIRGRDGKLYNKYGYYNIPGVTKNPTDPNSWMSGEVRTYYAEALGNQRSVFVCEGAKDVWRHWQALRGTHLASDLLLITSTHGSAIPEE